MNKVPGLDTLWDSVQTFILIPLGILLAIGVSNETTLAMQVAMRILGGGLATSTHILNQALE